MGGFSRDGTRGVRLASTGRLALVSVAVVAAVLAGAGVGFGLGSTATKGRPQTQVKGSSHPDAPNSSAPSGSSLVSGLQPLSGTSTVSPSSGPTTRSLQIDLSSFADGASGVDGSQPVVFSVSERVDTSNIAATVEPPIAGTWRSSDSRLSFVPQGAFPPDTKVTIAFPGGMRSAGGSTLAAGESFSFTTAPGSTLGLQILLAQLGYLPLKWQPSEPAKPGRGGRMAAETYAYDPPPGNFSWSWIVVPPSLAAQWAQGVNNEMVKGAVMSFESDHGLATDGVAGPKVWAALFSADSPPTPQGNSHGYTYAYVAKSPLPETMTVWHDDNVISTSRVNTGVAGAPTVDGTFTVYERLATQTMRGKNLDGTPYADPVAWVAYFNGGDAVHYIARSRYGYPQSLGCVEVPYDVGATVWPQLTIGSLVTISN